MNKLNEQSSQNKWNEIKWAIYKIQEKVDKNEKYRWKKIFEESN